jgi:putative transposase
LLVAWPARLRLHYPGAIYHVIDRGNYRRDVFETAGAASSFEATLGEASARFGREVHAFSILRNHFHVAQTTPVPNLGDGRHWPQIPLPFASTGFGPNADIFFKAAINPRS